MERTQPVQGPEAGPQEPARSRAAGGQGEASEDKLRLALWVRTMETIERNLGFIQGGMGQLPSGRRQWRWEARQGAGATDTRSHPGHWGGGLHLSLSGLPHSVPAVALLSPATRLQVSRGRREGAPRPEVRAGGRVFARSPGGGGLHAPSLPGFSGKHTVAFSKNLKIHCTSPCSQSSLRLPDAMSAVRPVHREGAPCTHPLLHPESDRVLGLPRNPQVGETNRQL